MSQNPKRKTTRKVSSAQAPPLELELEEEEFDFEDEQQYTGGYDYQERTPAKRAARTGRSHPRGRSERNYSAASMSPRRDPFPYIMGGLIGAVLVGLMILAYLLGTGSKSAPTNVVSNPINSSSGNQPTQQPGGTAIEPVRMPMAEFKALYDDPVMRPLIVDVRAKDRYAEGHIQGAVNIPDPETDVRLAEYPKDKPIILYCQ